MVSSQSLCLGSFFVTGLENEVVVWGENKNNNAFLGVLILMVILNEYPSL